MSNADKRVLVLGANGRLGRSLVLAFANSGWRVLAQTRRELPPEVAAHPCVQAVVADADGLEALVQAATGAACVVHAWNPSQYTDKAWSQQVLPMMSTAIAIARRSGAALMFPGNVYGFGVDLPATLETDTPQRPDTVKAQVRIQAEQLLAQAGAEGLDVTIVRAGDFFGGRGPGTWLDLAFLRSLPADLAAGRSPSFSYPGPMDQAHAWAYLPDLAASFVALAEARLQQPAGWQGLRCVHFEGHTLTGEQWRRALTSALGPAVKPTAFPWWLFQLGAWFNPQWRSLCQMRYLWRRPHRLAGGSMYKALEGRPLPSTPFLEALKASIRDQGWPQGLSVSAAASSRAA
jgi:nucleoside-diphosphate-sugar epimerase